jgi:branched-chain amino acid transport system substrate-binding protein
MIGPQNTSVKATLGPLLNGFVNYEYWVPSPELMFPGVRKLLEAYQSRAAASDVDPLGHYMAPLAYSQMQVVADAIKATGSLEDAKLAEYARTADFHTVMGIVEFGTNGEWSRPRVLQVQFQGIVGADLEQFRDGSRQTIVWPPELASGQLQFPYAQSIDLVSPGDSRFIRPEKQESFGRCRYLRLQDHNDQNLKRRITNENQERCQLASPDPG